MHELSELAIDLAKDAGEVLRSAYRTVTTIERKSSLIDLVTSADKESEFRIIDRLKKTVPRHAVLAEEIGALPAESDYQWVIDPLDGTVNFAHRIPHFAVLIAVQQRQRGVYETLCGVCYNPMLDELFFAEQGQGCFINNVPVGVSSSQRLIDSVASTGFAYDRLYNRDDNHAEFCRMNLLTRGVRRSGSAGLDLAYVACGRYDLFWEYGLKQWDLCAGVLQVREAGGLVTSPTGESFVDNSGELLATNGRLHDVAKAALASARGLPIGSRDKLSEYLPEELRNLG